ncbi:hypothetical protein PHMEG_00011723 [Phytophthora megakarya]|uniref:DDE Tnp4 domain-containing protein n=1 Tax=Phytophthora megakarya TaxID=4795 RepID=A0A225WB09_9STRA|nr:hypothetical protein PHMEG_00011723 [Phytophthora megakarya]
MYATQDDSAFLVTVSLPVVEYNLLLTAFSRHYIVKSGPGKRGRPTRLVNKNNVLACVLHFYTAAVEAKTLCEMFGVPPATLSRVLKLAEMALAKALLDVPAARICWPSFSDQEQWASSVQMKEPLIRGCFCVADGKNYAVHAPTASDLQNAYFNGWLHAVKVTGVLCYGFDGTLIWGRHNFPGSWNDGEMSRRLQARLADSSKTLEGFCCATDSAFPVSNELTGKIITPLKDGELERSSPECRLGLVAMSNSITAIRQAAEWGMGCASKVYRQLLLPLPFDPMRRGKRLDNIYHLYNIRVRATGISQIRSVYMQ